MCLKCNSALNAAPDGRRPCRSRAGVEEVFHWEILYHGTRNKLLIFKRCGRMPVCEFLDKEKLSDRLQKPNLKLEKKSEKRKKISGKVQKKCAFKSLKLTEQVEIILRLGFFMKLFFINSCKFSITEAVCLSHCTRFEY